MKKLGYIIISIGILTYSNVFSETSSLICNSSDGYKLYECRVKNTCNPYKPQPIFFQTKEYQNYDTEAINNSPIEGNDLIIAKNDYTNNMNSIYKCAIIGVQEKSLKTTKQLLSNNSYLKNKIQNKIDSKIKKLTLIKTSLGCKNNNDNNSIQKLQVLKQTTYELCKYNSYLEYLKERNRYIKNITPLEKETYNISTIANLERRKKTEIAEEIKRAYKIFPIAYHAYSEYENNFSIHILLELIREDFIAFRKNYHKTINPINQVGYKIINAMKK